MTISTRSSIDLPEVDRPRGAGRRHRRGWRDEQQHPARQGPCRRGGQADAPAGAGRRRAGADAVRPALGQRSRAGVVASWWSSPKHATTSTTPRSARFWGPDGAHARRLPRKPRAGGNGNPVRSGAGPGRSGGAVAFPTATLAPSRRAGTRAQVGSLPTAAAGQPRRAEAPGVGRHLCRAHALPARRPSWSG